MRRRRTKNCEGGEQGNQFAATYLFDFLPTFAFTTRPKSNAVTLDGIPIQFNAKAGFIEYANNAVLHDNAFRAKFGT